MTFKIEKPNKKKIPYLLIWVGYILFLGVICLFSYKRPIYNWDMLPYMAIVISYDGQHATSHQKIYLIAKQEIPEKQYLQLIDSTVATKYKAYLEPSEFNMQMPFYVIKPFYTGLIYVLNKIGFPLTKSTVLPSIIAFFLIGLLLLNWINKYINIYCSFLLSVLIMLLPPLTTVAKMSTPDCLSSFFLLLGVYYLLEKKRLTKGFLILLLAIFTRLDNIIFCITIIPLLAFFNFWPKKIPLTKHVLFISIMVVCYLIISLMSKAYGWSMLYYPSFLKHINSDNNIHQSFSFESYFKLIRKQVLFRMDSSYLPFFLFLMALIGLSKWPGHLRKLSIDQALMIFLFLMIVVRFILQPTISDRFYNAYYLIVLITLIKIMSRNNSTKLSQ